MEFGKNLKGSLVIGLILAGFVLVINPEARKDALGVLAAGMILAPSAVSLIWFFKKYPKPSTQFLLMFGLLGACILLSLLFNFLGLETLRGVFGVGIIASVLFIMTLAVIWVIRLGSRINFSKPSSTRANYVRNTSSSSGFRSGLSSSRSSSRRITKGNRDNTSKK